MKRLAVSVGEPAGIGPDIVIDLLQQSWPCQLVLVANEALLYERAEQIKLPLRCHAFDPDDKVIQAAGECYVLDSALAEPVTPGVLNPKNAAYVLAAIETATQLCLDGQADALVTGPVHKGNICDSGIPFDGHTDFLRDLAGVNKVVMMLAHPDLKVALVTTHIPLSAVPRAITRQAVMETVMIVHEAMKQQGVANPKIAVTGLNPHAGESGHMGREEIEVIEPALAELRKKGCSVFGPLPADTAFVPTISNQYDVIVAMYHDQGLAPIKTLGFDQTVNVTLGLPFLRTSVDHGTALDLAGSGRASASSLKAAVQWCL